MLTLFGMTDSEKNDFINFIYGLTSYRLRSMLSAVSLPNRTR